MADLKKTPLNDAHRRAGGKMVNFGGWDMPVQYPTGILAEHKAVRENVGVFDVSHMGEVDFRGVGALDAIQILITNDASQLTSNRALYTAICYPDGGIVDDCIVYRFGDQHYRIVVNASNIEKDVAHFRQYARSSCDIQDHSDEFALIAIQGPQAVALAAELGGSRLSDVPGFGLSEGQIVGTPIVAARTGYTGEDGFELFVNPADAVAVWDAVVAAGAIPAGLGARDTLRLEARLCLYGNDIDPTTSPLEAGLGWTVKLGKGVEFIGHRALAKQRAEGVTRTLIGFRVSGRGILRPGAEVLGEDGEPCGRVTSGSVAPTVGGAVGMAYVPKSMATPGKTLTVRQRGKTFETEIVKGPFYRRSK